MGTYEVLKQAISDVIKTNGNQEITGQLTQNVLVAIVNALGNNALFAGIAQTNTVPGTPDGNVFYLAAAKGIYTNFNAYEVTDKLTIFNNKTGNWVASEIDVVITSALDDVKNNIYVYDYAALTSLSQESGALKETGIVDPTPTGYYVRKYDISGLTNIAVTGRSGLGVYSLLCFYNSNNEFISAQYIGTQTNYSQMVISVPSGVQFIKISGSGSYLPACYSVQSQLAFYTKTEIPTVVANLTTQKADKTDIYNITSSNTQLSLDSVQENYALRSNGNVSANTGYFINKYLTTNKTSVSVTGRSGASSFCLACAFDANNNVLQAFEVGMSTNYTKLVINLPIGTAYVKVCGNTGIMPNAFETQYTLKFYTKEESDEKYATKEEIADKAERSDIYINEPQIIEGLTVVQGYYPTSSTGVITANSQWSYIEYNIQPDDILFATGFVRPSPTALAVYKDANGAYIGNQFVGAGTNTNYDKQLLTIPANAVKVLITGSSNTEPQTQNRPLLYKGVEQLAFYQKNETLSTEEIEQKIAETTPNYWNQKKIWWCGTSIPAGGYPQLVGQMLNCTVNNRAQGSSGCRRSTLSGDFTGMYWQNMAYSLSQTAEEKEYIIANWATIQPILMSGAPTILSTSEQTLIRSCTFEQRLLPYINESDLFVYDHGHNDWKYNKPSNFGGGSDIGVLPTVENIQSGLLAEDTYMTANNNAKLVELFGDLSKIPNLNNWIASINRNCFIGATNFIMMVILKNKPHGRIAMVSNNRLNKQGLIEAQLLNSENWFIPIAKVYEYLMYSNFVIPGTSNYWGDARTNDLTVFDLYNKDGVHPSSDTTGDANRLYAGILSEFIKKIR